MERYRRCVIIVLLMLGAAGANAQTATVLPANTVERSTPSASLELKEIARSFVQGRELERRGAFQLAAQAYRQVISASPEYIEARYRLASVLRAIDPKSQEALDHLRFCVSRQPAHIGRRMELAAALSQAGLTVNAIEQLEVLRRLAPNDPRTTYRLAELYWAQQDGERAGRLLDELVERYPRRQGPAVLRAQVYRKQGEYEKALSLLDRTLTADPTNRAALMERGKAYVAIGDATSAARDLDMAVRSNPMDPEAYRLLSQVRLMRGDRAGAKQALELATAFEKLPEQRAQRLFGLYRKQRRTPAEEVELGSLLAGVGRKDLAVPLLERGLKRRPRDRAAWHLLGKMRYESGDYQGAADAFKAAAPYMKRRNRRDYYRYLSTALTNAGNIAEAQKYVTEGLRSFPKDPTLLEVQAKLRAARQPKREPEMTSVEKNRLQQMERKRRWLEEKRRKKGPG